MLIKVPKAWANTNVHSRIQSLTHQGYDLPVNKRNKKRLAGFTTRQTKQETQDPVLRRYLFFKRKGCLEKNFNSVTNRACQMLIKVRKAPANTNDLQKRSANDYRKVSIKLFKVQLENQKR
ncbi:MAG TPA: hypothetical protein DHV48_10620 [Prolixibacteraceae bacterium]|nr:hypothetical protein [Prolixibacteraceae bacterium]